MCGKSISTGVIEENKKLELNHKNGSSVRCLVLEDEKRSRLWEISFSLVRMPTSSINLHDCHTHYRRANLSEIVE
jgi:hypothetical protein